MSDIWVALRMIDWSTFHPCGHPAQRWKGAVLPCAECYTGYPRRFVAERPKLTFGLNDTTMPADGADFKKWALNLKAYETLEGATGRLWEPEV